MNAYVTRTRMIQDLANRAMARYPQYFGHFDSYVLVQITRTVKTKMGVAFTAGEYAIAHPGSHTSTNVQGKTNTFYTVWSVTNNCDTSVAAKDVMVVAA